MTDLGAARWTLARWPGARFFALALAALMICPLSPAAAAGALSELVVVTASGHHAFLVELDSDRVASALAASAREAFERGAFGVPTFFVGQRMFWGNDRLPLVRHAVLAGA